jgi:hypothetical protein
MQQLSLKGTTLTALENNSTACHDMQNHNARKQKKSFYQFDSSFQVVGVAVEAVVGYNAAVEAEERGLLSHLHGSFCRRDLDIRIWANHLEQRGVRVLDVVEQGLRG